MHGRTLDPRWSYSVAGSLLSSGLEGAKTKLVEIAESQHLALTHLLRKGKVPRMQLWLRCFISLSVAGLCACPGPLKYEAPPENQFYYPQSMVQSGDRLLVVSSNRNQRYDSGSIISIDLTKVDSQLNKSVIKTPDVVDHFMAVSSFSLSPLIVANQILLLSQEKHELISVPWNYNQLGTPIRTKLAWRNPYYLQENIVGYVHDPIRERIDLTSPQIKFGELQFDQETIHIEKWLKDDEKPSTDKNMYPSDTTDNSVIRRFSHIGNMRIIGSHLLLAVDAPLSYTNLSYTQTASHLLWIPMADLNNNTKPEQVALTPLLDGATSIASFDLSSDTKEIFVITTATAMLAKIDLDQDKLSFRQAVSICDRPTAIRISPDNQTVLVACGSDSQIEAYNTLNLAFVGSEKPAKALSPAQILFDNRNNFKNRFYVSYLDSGTIGVFQLNNTSSNRIEFLGQIGETAALNHLGGFQP